MAPGLADIVDSLEVRRLATGFQFTEGPLWHPDGFWLFVDTRPNLIFRLVPGSKPEVIRENSGRSNGLTFDLQGRLIMCEGHGRRVSRMEADGSVTTVADRWQDRRLNRPNDVVGRSDGSVYFTDPGQLLDPSLREMGFNGVFRIAPNGAVAPVATDMELPNGLAFSPDERTLYVANTRARKHIRAFDVRAGGSLTEDRVFADLSSAESEGAPDGMKVDEEGRVYCTGPGGLWVFDPSGRHLVTVPVPEVPSNCAWGGPDHRTMLITARTSVYSVRMKTPGTRVPRAG
jgi:gluconolactonase